MFLYSTKSPNKYLLIIYCVPDTVLSNGDIMLNKTAIGIIFMEIILCLHRLIYALFIKARSCLIRGFPCGSGGKESAHSAGNLGSIPGLGRFPGKEKGYPLQYSGLKNSIDCIVHGVAKSQTRLSNFHFTVCQHEVTTV